jgi:hypothetical protein
MQGFYFYFSFVDKRRCLLWQLGVQVGFWMELHNKYETLISSLLNKTTKLVLRVHQKIRVIKEEHESIFVFYIWISLVAKIFFRHHPLIKRALFA